jgi:hypothetical protein
MVPQTVRAGPRAISVLGLVIALAAASARANDSVRILLSIGQNVGASYDEPLLYAERDARLVTQVFTSFGDVDPKRVYLIEDASADRVREAIAEIRGRVAELKDVVLIVYVSAHADQTAVHLGGSRLPHAELHELVASVHARLSLVFVDTCDSGALVRNKGGRPVRPFAIDLESADRLRGQVTVTASGPNEPAQEWEALGGSLFTHYFTSALRGAADRNGDGRVSLFEAYSYTYERTLSASVSTNAGTQHPSQDIDLHGAGDVILTRPGGLTTGLVFGARLSGRYIVTSVPGGDLVAEIDKSPQRAMRLALPAGRYMIRKREGDFVRVGEVFVGPRGNAAVDDSAMEQAPYIEVTRRGFTNVRPWAVELGIGGITPDVRGAHIVPSYALQLRRERGPWDFAIGVSASFDDYPAQSLAITQRELWLGADARLRFPLHWALPYAGAHAAAAWVHQTLERDNEQKIRQVFNVPTLADRDGALLQLLAALGLELPLSARALARIEVAFGVTVGRVEPGWAARPTANGRIAGGWRF